MCSGKIQHATRLTWLPTLWVRSISHAMTHAYVPFRLSRMHPHACSLAGGGNRRCPTPALGPGLRQRRHHRRHGGGGRHSQRPARRRRQLRPRRRASRRAIEGPRRVTGHTNLTPRLLGGSGRPAHSDLHEARATTLAARTRFACQIGLGRGLGVGVVRRLLTHLAKLQPCQSFNRCRRPVERDGAQGSSWT